MHEGKEIKVAIIGGGAAGFFAALSVKKHHPQAEVVILEKSQKLLSKVKISGGGRCNVTNGTLSISELSKGYPRGSKKLKKLFKTFYTKDTFEWFEQRDVPLYVQDDNRAFPVSDDSQSIIDCFMKQTKLLGISIELGQSVESLEYKSNSWELIIKNEEDKKIFDKVIVAAGGSPKLRGFDWLKNTKHSIVPPVPSLFTFNMPDEPIVDLMGLVAPMAQVSIQGTKLKSVGPVLITHWGMSGPGILKLSAFGARTLHELDYKFIAQINWVNISNNDLVYQEISQLCKEHPKKSVANFRPFELPKRLWHFILQKAGLDFEKQAGELGNKTFHRLVNLLCNDQYEVNGKTTFKEEFVTCGGISLEEINFKTMGSNLFPNLYFAGEILDIDGITGGYNFQAAWTTAFVAGKLLDSVE